MNTTTTDTATDPRADIANRQTTALPGDPETISFLLDYPRAVVSLTRAPRTVPGFPAIAPMFAYGCWLVMLPENPTHDEVVRAFTRTTDPLPERAA